MSMIGVGEKEHTTVQYKQQSVQTGSVTTSSRGVNAPQDILGSPYCVDNDLIIDLANLCIWQITTDKGNRECSDYIFPML